MAGSTGWSMPPASSCSATSSRLDFATWRRVLGVNLDGAFLGCKYSLPLLRKKGGAIVNLSSVSGLVGGHNLAAYNASKGGLSLLTKSVALYGARLKPPVRCNAVCPAFVEGPMVDDIAQGARDPETAQAEDDARHSARPPGQAGRGRRSLRLSVVGRSGLHHRRGFADRRRADGATIYPRISAVTCAATERARPCKS